MYAGNYGELIMQDAADPLERVAYYFKKIDVQRSLQNLPKENAENIEEKSVCTAETLIFSGLQRKALR